MLVVLVICEYMKIIYFQKISDLDADISEDYRRVVSAAQFNEVCVAVLPCERLFGFVVSIPGVKTIDVSGNLSIRDMLRVLRFAAENEFEVAWFRGEISYWNCMTLFLGVID